MQRPEAEEEEDVASKVVTDPIATFDEWTKEQLEKRQQVCISNFQASR